MEDAEMTKERQGIVEELTALRKYLLSRDGIPTAGDCRRADALTAAIAALQREGQIEDLERAVNLFVAAYKRQEFVLPELARDWLSTLALLVSNKQEETHANS